MGIEMTEFLFTPRPFVYTSWSGQSLNEQRRNHAIHELFRMNQEYMAWLPPKEAKASARASLLASGLYVEGADGGLVLAPEYGGPGADDDA